MLSLSFLAIMLGALMVASRLPGVFYPKAFAKFAKHLIKDKPRMQILAGGPFAFAVAILLQKYDFTPDWTTVMAVLGWLMLVASFWVAWFPKHVEKTVAKMLKKHNFISFSCFVAVALGVGLMYLGFNVY